MVTTKTCSICNHPTDNHSYPKEEIDTELGKIEMFISNCDIEGCNCKERNIKNIQKKAKDQKEHG